MTLGDHTPALESPCVCQFYSTSPICSKNNVYSCGVNSGNDIYNILYTGTMKCLFNVVTKVGL